jgi:fido (protein-threonine AMPylation protein)/DNA-binding transcriptional ArsR family regulator
MATSPRTDDIVKFLLDQLDPLSRQSDSEWVSASDLASLLKVDRTTAFRDLQGMRSGGLVQAEGDTRNRRYRLNRTSAPFIRWELGQPPTTRVIAQYNPAILKAYEPNVTKWLTTEQSKALADLTHGAATTNEASYRRVMNSLLIDLSYASSRLEDVRITWLDTKSLVELGERPDGLSEKEFRIVSNHKTAIQYICDYRGDIDISRRTLLKLHQMLNQGLLGNPSDEGRMRLAPVHFTESAYRPISIPQQLDDETRLFCDKAVQIADPFEQALFTMAMISYLQPFMDGNKRTSRLCMNIPLLKRSLAPFSFTDINRRDYTFALLAFYERGRIDFLAKVFADTYVRSAPRYNDLLSLLSEGGVLSTVEVTPPTRQEAPARRKAKPR